MGIFTLHFGLNSTLLFSKSKLKSLLPLCLVSPAIVIGIKRSYLNSSLVLLPLR
jgi:hypothetical protein